MLINGHHLYVETHGPEDGYPVVLLHHGLGSTHAWQEQVPALVQAGYRVVVYDRWGYGQSDPRPALGTPTFTADLNDLLELLESLNIKHSTFLGHSDGGTIALYFAALYPKRVTKLVTVAAHIYIEAKMEPGIEDIRQTFEGDQRFRKGMQRVHGEKFENVFRNWYDGWHKPECLEWDLRPLLPQITCPTLVIQGEEDEHATPQHAHDIAEAIADSELWLVPGGKHMLPQEMAETFNQRVLEFLCSTKS
jgi:pimeloyl-ACP methyl ester carboxylesterase